MSFKNAIKLLIAKFSLVWSVLLYTVIVGAVIGLVMVWMWVPAFHAMQDAGFVTEISNAIVAWSQGDLSLMKALTVIGDNLSRMGETILNYPASVALTPIVIFVVGRLALGLKDVAVCSCLDAHMSAHMKVGFWESYFRNFRRSGKLVLSRTLFTLPFDAAIFALMWGGNLLLRVLRVGYLAPFFLVLILVTLVPFKKLIFSLWPAYIAAEGNHTFSAMRRGLKLGFRYPGRIYSNWVVTEVFGLAFNVLIGLLTMGAGLLITLPLTLALESMLSMTILYNHSKRRYYLDNGEIFVPEGAPAIDAEKEESFD